MVEFLRAYYRRQKALLMLKLNMDLTKVYLACPDVGKYTSPYWAYRHVEYHPEEQHDEELIKLISQDIDLVAKFAHNFGLRSYFLTSRVSDTSPMSIQYEYVSEYILKILKSRSVEAEHRIYIDSRTSSLNEYRTEILKGRVPSQESKIYSDILDGFLYIKKFDLGRVFEYEQNLLQNGTPAELLNYIHMAVKGRWLAAEPILATSPMSLYNYLYYFVRCRAPTLEHELIKMDSKVGLLYVLETSIKIPPEFEDFSKIFYERLIYDRPLR